MTPHPYSPIYKGRDGVYRQVAARLLVAANDNLVQPLCRQTYDLERALEQWREKRQGEVALCSARSCPQYAA